MDPNATPPSGVTINIPGYTLISELGKGGMATVYLAIQQNFGRKVAIKIMSPALNADPTFSERFLREARIVAGLSHPNIVQVYDVGEYDNYHYIAMEYHPGGDLQERIAKGLSAEESVRIIEQIALALDYAHSKGYIHRDVKPDNVLFREDGSAVLTDFGIAKPTSKNTRQMTQVGKVIGTPKYMSPEQARGQELDARSDLYALGVMFYEMLTGAVPFDGEDPIAIGIKHIKDPVPRMGGEAAAFQEVMETILAKSVEDRYQHGRDFVEALEQVAYTHTDGRRRPSRGKLAASPSGRIGRVNTPAAATAPGTGGSRTLLWVALSAITLAAAGAGLTLVFRQPVPAQQVQPTDTTTHAPAPLATAAMPPPAEPVPANDAPATPEPAPEPAPAAPADSAPVADSTATEPETAPAGEAVAATDPPPAADDSLAPLVQRLLEEAELALEKRQLTRPEGESALDKYREVLALAPDNADAQSGIRKVATTYVVMARESTAQQDFRKARDYLQQARELAADAAGLDSATKSLESAEQQARQQRQAAEKAAAEKTREANQTDLMVERFRITGLLKSAEYHLANDQLADPPGDNAWDTYAEILRIDPGNAEAKAGQKRVGERLVALVTEAVDAGNGDKARHWLAQALRVTPANPRIKQLRAAVDQLP